MPPSLPEFLEQHGLIAYGPIFDEKGYDHLRLLLTINEDDLRQLIVSVSMKEGHAQRLRAALGKPGPATARATAPRRRQARQQHCILRQHRSALVQ